MFLRRLSFFVAILLFSVISCFAGPFISTNEIHPGMVGYGRTVFHGTTISTFKVTVLGILKKALADTDLILVKIDSPYLEKKGLGLVAGMSGSPVYFNGKLAGAVAYGWSFTREAIAGVTPIKAMLSSESVDEQAHDDAMVPHIFHLQSALHVGSKTIQTVSVSDGQVSANVPDGMALAPFGITLAASGFNPEGLEDLQKIFPAFMVVPGGGKMPAKQPVDLEPGQSVGALLMQGDLNVEATGTLTYRDGNKILAFGHPFMLLGDVDFPLSESYVHYILPSLELPFKFSSTITDVGHLIQDRQYGVEGIIGAPARMIPIDITISDVARHADHHYHVEIVRSPMLAPKLAALALGQAIPATAKSLGTATASLDYQIQFEGQPPIHKHNLIFSDSSIAAAASAEILKPVMEVMDNDFQRVNLAKLTLDVKVLSGIKAATIQKVMLSKHEVMPGDSVGIAVWLRPYNEKIIKKNFTFKIPQDIQGNVSLGIAGGIFDDQLRKALSQPPPEPLAVDQIIRSIQEEPPYDSLVVRLQLPRSGVNLGGENFRNFPSAYINLLKSSGLSPLAAHADGLVEQYPMPWVVVGTDTEQLTVKGKENSSSSSVKPVAPPVPPSQPQPPMPTEETANTVVSAPVSPAVPQQQPQIQPEKKPESASPSAAAPPSLPEAATSTHLQTYADLTSWQQGVLKNLAVSSEGNLGLASQTKLKADFGENVIFSQAAAGDSLYVGTVMPGKIYEISPSGERKLFFDPKTIAVLSLATLPNGDVLAGTIDGALYWLSSKGKLRYKHQFSEHYIWQILPANREVYVATGNPHGTIYTLDGDHPEKAPQVYAVSQQSHILCLYPSRDGNLFAGTANSALLLRIKPGGKVETLADLDQQAILSLAGDEKGNLYIGTDGKGQVYELSVEGQLHLLASLPEEDVSWLGISGGKVLAATGIPARLYAISANGNPALLWDGKPEEAFGLRGDSAEKYFVISGSHAAAFERLDIPFQHGEYVSNVIDAGTQALWGRLMWLGSIPQGTTAEVQTRAGNSPVPDATWSPWSFPYSTNGMAFLSPSSRYVQFQVLLSQNVVGTGPSMQTLSFFWKPVNRPPSVSVSSPQPSEVIGPLSTLRGKLQDANGDTLEVELWAKQGSESKKVYSKLFPTTMNSPQDFSIPLNVIHQEGPLDLRVMVSDAPSNNLDSVFTTQADVKDLTYASAPPTLNLTQIHVAGDRLDVQGVAEDPASYVKDVEFKINDGPWLQTVTQNGMFDLEKESFSFYVDGLSDVKEIEVQAEDAAGNQTSVKKSAKDLGIPESASSK